MRPICYALVASALFLISGCGGSGTSVQGSTTARLAFAIEWPSQSRFIHQSADRLDISAKVNGTAVRVDTDGTPYTATVQRPSGSGTSSELSLDNLPTGPITFVVESFRNSDSQILGKAVVPTVLVPGDNPNLEFVLESQTSTVEVTLEPAGTVRRVGQLLTLNASSKQGTATVIQGSGEFTFAVSDTSKLQLVGNNQVRVIAEGTSQITAMERGNDSTGKSGTATVRTDEYEQSEWSLTNTNLPVSQSGTPVFSSTPAYKDGVVYFGYGKNLLSVDPSGSWTQTTISGLEADVIRVELIGVGPGEDLYVRGFVQTGAFTFSVRDIYRVSSGFVATRVANAATGPVAIAHTFCVTRAGLFGSFVPSPDNSSWTLYAGPVSTQSAWGFPNALSKPNFQLLDSGGALVWNKVDGITTQGSHFISNFTPGQSNSTQEITVGGEEVAIATMNQQGYWQGTIKGSPFNSPVIGRNGSVIHAAQLQGSLNYSVFPNPDGVTAFPVYSNGIPDHWRVFNPLSGSSGTSWQIDLGGTDLTALGIHAVVNGGVMVASYEGKVAILKRTN